MALGARGWPWEQHWAWEDWVRPLRCRVVAASGQGRAHSSAVTVYLENGASVGPSPRIRALAPLNMRAVWPAVRSASSSRGAIWVVISPG